MVMSDVSLPHRVIILSCRALDPELHAELTKGGRQIAWRFIRRLFRLFDRAGEGLGVGVDDTERLFQVCATSDQDILQVHLHKCKAWLIIVVS